VKLAAVIVLAIGAVWVWTHHERTSSEHALAAVAAPLAGREAGVRCQGFFAELVDVQGRAGDVQFPNGRAPDHMFLTRKVCKALDRFRESSSHRALECLLHVDWSRWSASTGFRDECSRRVQTTAQAINTLAHESMHLRGFANEAEAQCYAIQHDAWTVMRLGGTSEDGAAVAQYILALQSLLPSEYQSSECRAGGQLDLHPETPAFPTETVPGPPPPALRGRAFDAPTGR
jgi:hypothetical protein